MTNIVNGSANSSDKSSIFANVSRHANPLCECYCTDAFIEGDHAMQKTYCDPVLNPPGRAGHEAISLEQRRRIAGNEWFGGKMNPQGASRSTINRHKALVVCDRKNFGILNRKKAVATKGAWKWMPCYQHIIPIDFYSKDGWVYFSSVEKYLNFFEKFKMRENDKGLTELAGLLTDKDRARGTFPKPAKAKLPVKRTPPEPSSTGKRASDKGSASVKDTGRKGRGKPANRSGGLTTESTDASGGFTTGAPVIPPFPQPKDWTAEEVKARHGTTSASIRGGSSGGEEPRASYGSNSDGRSTASARGKSAVGNPLIFAMPAGREPSPQTANKSDGEGHSSKADSTVEEDNHRNAQLEEDKRRLALHRERVKQIPAHVLTSCPPPFIPSDDELFVNDHWAEMQEDCHGVDNGIPDEDEPAASEFEGEDRDHRFQASDYTSSLRHRRVASGSSDIGDEWRDATQP